MDAPSVTGTRLRDSLVDALISRRSRRFGKGFHLESGPLAYHSEQLAEPLSLGEEAALAFAATGVTGYALGELPYQPGPMSESGGGNVLIHLIGRTIPGGDAAHAVALVVINDDGAWLLKRPQDYARGEIDVLIDKAHRRQFTGLYLASRLQIADRRIDVPREVPQMPAFNKWSANRPGTTYFLPIAEMTALYINLMLAGFSQEPGVLMVDERNRYRPAGVGRFARSKGGHLHDDPSSGRVGTILLAETWLQEFVAIEQGAMLQNLGLMAAALDLGGFVHFAAHPYAWTRALGFRMQDIPFSRTIGGGTATRAVLRLLRRDIPVPTALGLEQDGALLLKPFCPPYYPSMRDAVLAFVEYKFGHDSGTLRDGGSTSGWRDGAEVQRGIPGYTDEAIAATIAYCEYVYRRYGRFPAYSGPFRTVMAYQAHRLDPAFYDRFYRSTATGFKTC